MGKRKQESEDTNEKIKSPRKVVSNEEDVAAKPLKSRKRATQESNEEILFISMNKRHRSNTINLR